MSGRRPVRGWLLARDLLVAERLQQGPQQRGRALGCVDGHVGSMQEFRWRLIAAHRDPCRADPAGGQLVEGAKRRQVADVVTEITCGADRGGPLGYDRALVRADRRDATRPLCAELKWLAAALGPARDGEVLLARLTAELAAIPPALVAGPVQARITGCFTAGLAQAGQTALAALDGQRYLRLLDDLDALLADPPLTPRAERKAGKVLGKPVRRAARRLQRALAAVPAAGDRDAAIHEARKTAKRARYAAEAAVPALGSTASRQAARAKELQQLLGDHHNSVVARTVLLDLAGKARAAGEDTFTYGLMHQRQACQAATIEQALPCFTAARRDRTTGH